MQDVFPDQKVVTCKNIFKTFSQMHKKEKQIQRVSEDQAEEGLVAHLLLNESWGYCVADKISGTEAQVRGSFRWAQASFL